jgi:hypothetical protein
MKLSYRSALGLCIIALTVSYSCNTQKHAVAVKAGPYAGNPVVIDGDDKDWPSPYPNYDGTAFISYAVCNDRDNLYLSIKASDQRMRMKILRGGMKVWIDTTGKKGQYMCVQSPMPGAIGMHSDELPRNDAEDAALSPVGVKGEWKDQMLLTAGQFALSGFGSCDGTYTDGKPNSCGVKVKLGLNDYKELIWEAAIPFAAWHHGGLTSKDKGKPISICFELAGLKRPIRTNGEGGGRGGHMGAGNGMGGGRGQGGGRGGAMGGQRGGGYMRGGGSAEEAAAISQTTRTWVKTGLAYR